MKDTNGGVMKGCDVYIGRAVSNLAWDLPRSKWANPFFVKNYEHSHADLQKYEKHLRSDSELMSHLGELEGKTLGCWCKPKSCHGDVLVKLLEEKKETEIHEGLFSAGLELVRPSDLSSIRRARKWANHPMWLAHATRLDNTDIFYFTPQIYRALCLIVGGYRPEYFEVRTFDHFKFFVVGTYVGTQPIGPFWVETEQSHLSRTLDPVFSFAKKVQSLVEDRRPEMQDSLERSIKYLELHRAIVRRVGEALGRSMDDHDLTKSRIVQVALAYRWHWLGKHETDLIASADCAIRVGHCEQENHHPEFSRAGRGEVNVDKLLIDRLAVHIQKDQFDDLKGWDVQAKWIPEQYLEAWADFRDKFGHIDLYYDAYYPAQADVQWAHEAKFGFTDSPSTSYDGQRSFTQ